MQSVHHHLWGIILAGGDGQRLQPFIQEHLHSERPKQYCTFFGTQSLLRRTIYRAEYLIPSERVLTVITQHHQPYIQDELADRLPGTVLVQPCNRETGPGILFALWHIQQCDPEAIVALFPSDHFVLGGQRFMATVQAAATFVARESDRMVLLGVPPTQAETDYGWIEVGQEVGQEGEKHLYQVQQFWEKPAQAQAQLLLQQGCLWNTMLLVGRLSLLMASFVRLAPTLVEAFQHFHKGAGGSWAAEELKGLYAALPQVNFSQTILSQSAQQLAVLPLIDVYWSDWGDAKRLLQDLARFGYPLPVSQVQSAPQQARRAS